MSNIYPKGSVWRKWDLHVHAPLCKLYDGYKAGKGEDILEKFCDKIEMSDVMVYGITDYFSFESFKTFMKKFKEKYPDSKKGFFFNLELRLNEAINREVEEVNVHLVFNPDSLGEVEKFLSRLSVVKTGKDEAPIMCTDLDSDDDFESATVTRDSINAAFSITFGPKAIRRDHLLVLTAANNDGIRPVRGKKRKEGICDEIDKFSDGFFGGIQNSEHYLNEDRLEDDQKIARKPAVAGSDAHSFEELDNFLGLRVVEEIVEDGKITERIIKDVTWIKADPTFEGIKQIFYEPIPGERVFIGPVKPDQKDDYKVIRKIKFNEPNTFPEEIIFNGNLSSIIGSRSSGKSALLAYVAHSVDPTFVEEVIDGPGEGEDYHWNNLNIDYSIEWENGESSKDCQGRVVYIPQNYLFEESKNPDVIKRKIEPVLFRVLPDFKEKYLQSIVDIDSANKEIQNKTGNWFDLMDSLERILGELKDYGDKKAIENEKGDVNAEIQKLNKRHSLSDKDVKEYQRISGEISKLEATIKQIENELTKFSGISVTKGYFTAISLNLIPSLEGLPIKLKGFIKESLKGNEDQILNTANKHVNDYKDSISIEKTNSQATIEKIKTDNNSLIEKYQKNLELEGLVKKFNALEESIKKIDEKEKEKKEVEDQMKTCITEISTKISERSNSLGGLLTTMDNIQQDTLQGIEFGVEYNSDEALENVTRKINLKEKSDFVINKELMINQIRSNPEKFLKAIHKGEQKIIVNNNKRDVVKDTLTLTEKVLFTAKMEGDKIGGFSESTMTPGKRALFALRLILIESEDTWPLLIDQPEDDLDSRSIYDDVVPFLKEKKRERQIIMVTHNANLVVGSDSEQVIIANRNGNDRKNEDGKEFNYLSGSLEQTQKKDKTCNDTLHAQGICEHACEILDGGKTAFESRKNKYNIR